MSGLSRRLPPLFGKKLHERAGPPRDGHALLAVDLCASPLLQMIWLGPRRRRSSPRSTTCCVTEGEAYAAPLRRAGVHIHRKRWDGQIHDLTLMAERIADAETALRKAGEALRLALQAE